MSRGAIQDHYGLLLKSDLATSDGVVFKNILYDKYNGFEFYIVDFQFLIEYEEYNLALHLTGPYVAQLIRFA